MDQLENNLEYIIPKLEEEIERLKKSNLRKELLISRIEEQLETSNH